MLTSILKYCSFPIKFFQNFFSKFPLIKKKKKILTFTYYIPAPPPRSTGYREKEFDYQFYQFVSNGYRPLSIQTASHTGPNHSGMWIVCTVETTKEDLCELDFNVDNLTTNSSTHSNSFTEQQDITFDIPIDRT